MRPCLYRPSNLGVAVNLLLFFGGMELLTANAQTSANLDLAQPVLRAGETLNMSIQLDQAVNFTGGTLQVHVTGPRLGNQEPVTISFGADIPPGQKVIPAHIALPMDAVSGTWYVDSVSFFSGSKSIVLSSKRVPFEVESNPNLKFPHSAEVSINPSQIQLLRGEAKNLQSH